MFVTGLRCLRCHGLLDPAPDHYLCPTCGDGETGGNGKTGEAPVSGGQDPGILDIEYDYDAVARAVKEGDGWLDHRRDLFRYLPLLPVDSPGPGPPAGGTPLVPAPRLARRLGLRALYLKDEARNPTRCLKDRATAVGVTLALSLERNTVYCASAGNAAISLAGFAAHLGLECRVFVPNRASPERLRWLRRYGAHIQVSDGNYDQAFAESEREGRREGWYSRNCAFNPYLVEGKKTAALEIAQELGWEVPDVVVSPVGDGCTLAAQGKGFRELRTLGLVDRTPALLGVQAAGVSPLVERLHNAGGAPTHPATPSGTRAASIDVKGPRNARRVLSEVESSGGTLLSVDDPAIQEAQEALARDAGTVAEFTSAATLAGLQSYLTSEGAAARDLTAVLLITGGRWEED